MRPILKYTFIIILILSAYHLVRDIFQMIGIHNAFTNILHWKHSWCGEYCDYVTYPLDLLGVVGSLIVIRRNKLGMLGKIVLLSLLLWFLALILP